MIRPIPAPVIAWLAILVCACQPVVPYVPPPQVVARGDALYSTWELVSIDGSAVPANKIILTLKKGGNFTAMVDCNMARGTFSYDGAKLFFHGWEATQRGCESNLPNERAIVSAITGRTFSVIFPSSSDLQLSDGHKLIFRRHM